MTRIQSSMALVALTLAVQVHADCPAQFPSRFPEIPSGVTASEAEMTAAQTAAKTFVAEGERYLECAKLHDLTHNFYVSQLNRVARAYNDELNRYLEREVIAGLQ